ncbi:TIGR00730 family Rossman fold protein [Salibacterium salarium]|uniref:Cytokinin riboside 5'-monophosphate phosphoribohydrolase n=1 Tax=Salibacterium salarium TaxID=284579 RepID=A0A428N8R1_9BACI|nr:TIGR00730 family Rossman fold protein [Salibacterium salarium]RSL34757.1 TIGR00730 family Rossman fold protein [Salibacterium salarium]
MERLAVFCGSSEGASSVYKEGAVLLGKELARRNITLVYGGASVGLMGAVADAVIQEGGEVIGVIPKKLRDREIAHPNVTELIVVDTMHERKAKMADYADGFIALPGGPGTLEEFIEIFTWAQLGLHQKPCGLLNINHYYDPLVSLFHHMTDEQFLSETYRNMALVDESPVRLMEQFETYTAPAVKTYNNR